MRFRNRCPGLLCLLGASVSLGAWVAGIAPAVAQEGRGERRETRALADLPESRPAETADRDAARTPFFFDDFSSPTLDRRNWEYQAGVTAPGDSISTERPGVRLGGGWGPGDLQPELRSVVILLENLAGAELAYEVQHRSVEAGETLAVEYLSRDRQWHTIERVVADGRDSIGFSRRMHVLPASALHGAFRIRFRASVDDADDAWFLGEVSLTGVRPAHSLLVRVHPAREAHVEVVPAGGRDRLDGTTPLARSILDGTRVHVVAPPVVDERIFSHWSVDGVLQPDRQRVLTLVLSQAAEVVAHYRPWVPDRSAASVAIVSVPERGVRIALGPDADRLYSEVIGETEYRCLVGEWLALLAPPRTDRVVFTGWVVNGQALPTGDNLLEHRVAGDDVLLAEYVLLGDMNGDGAVDKFDVEEFVAALIDPGGYAEQYPDLDRTQRGDINGDGVFNALDVEAFVDLLLGE